MSLGHDGAEVNWKKGMGGAGVRSTLLESFNSALTPMPFIGPRMILLGFMAGLQYLFEPFRNSPHSNIHDLHLAETQILLETGIISTILREALGEVLLFFPLPFFPVNEMEIPGSPALLNVEAKIPARTV